MNLITRLRTLEAKIYAADAHEAHKYAGQFQDALYEAWPKLLETVEAAQAHYNADAADTFLLLGDALAALEMENE